MMAWDWEGRHGGVRAGLRTAFAGFDCLVGSSGNCGEVRPRIEHFLWRVSHDHHLDKPFEKD